MRDILTAEWSTSSRYRLSFLEPHFHLFHLLQAKGQFKRRSTANNVEILIPVPADADSPRFRVSLGNSCNGHSLFCLLSAVKCWLLQVRPREECTCLEHQELSCESLSLIQPPCVWVCLCIQGGREFVLRAHFGLPSVESEEGEGRPPIKVQFEIPYFTTSGIQVFAPFTIQMSFTRSNVLLSYCAVCSGSLPQDH